MREYCDKIALYVQSLTRSDEQFTCWFSGEDSVFARINRAKIRQIGKVWQLDLSIDISQSSRHAKGSIGLCADSAVDFPAIRALLDHLRQQRECLPDDPYYRSPEVATSSEDVRDDHASDASIIIRNILDEAQDLDFVGILTIGPVFRGFANSEGQRNWYQRTTFLLDFSCFLPNGRAVKNRYCDQSWNALTFRSMIQDIRSQFEVLKRPAITLKPGEYRTYLAPTALMELFGLLGFSAFSCKAQRTRQSPLTRLINEPLTLHHSVTIDENHADGMAPQFTPEGDMKPARVALVSQGRHADCLIDTRSAMEYGLTANSAVEETHSLDMAAGILDVDGLTRNLGQGLIINNLWYTNYSDWNDCRITGMTRYAAFWAEDGYPVAPIETMRFDDSFYRTFGEALIGLTSDRQFLIDSHSYERRSTISYRLPGALIADFKLTL